MIKVIYHGNCPDGFTSAWAAWKSLGDKAKYIPVNYGQEPIQTKADDSLFFLDFTYPRETMENLARASLTILDHHKSAEEALKDLKDASIVFDMERSGAGITWDHFHRGKPRPALVNYIEDHDLWRFNLKRSRDIRAYIRSFPYYFGDWDSLAQQLEDNFYEAADLGFTVDRFVKLQAQQIADEAILIDGIPSVNASSLWSEVVEELNRRFPEAPYGQYWFKRRDGKIQFGLRTQKDDVDVSEIAKRMGGGGHRKAAGFVVSP